MEKNPYPKYQMIKLGDRKDKEACQMVFGPGERDVIQLGRMDFTEFSDGESSEDFERGLLINGVVIAHAGVFAEYNRKGIVRKRTGKEADISTYKRFIPGEWDEIKRKLEGEDFELWEIMDRAYMLALRFKRDPGFYRMLKAKSGL